MITLQQGTIYLGTAAPASGGGGSGDAVWGSITGTLSNQTDLATALAAKQDVLTAGTGIDITNNVISATGGGSTTALSVENKNTAVGATNPLNLWEGTSAEYETGGGSQTWYNWQSGGSDVWTNETSNVSVNLRSITYGNNKYIAVGISGTVISSNGNGTWTTETSGITNPLSCVLYADNKFIAAGYGGKVISSSDGSNWSLSNTGISSLNSINRIIYADSKYISICDSGYIYSSTNGSNWTSETSGTITSLKDIIYANNEFVAVGSSGILLKSSNGSTWTSSTINSSYNFSSIAYGNGVYVTVGNDGMFVSSDSINWNNINNDSYLFVFFDGIKFIAIKFDAIVTSTDGSNWVNIHSVNDVYYSACYNNNKYIYSGASGKILSQTVAQSSEVFTTDSAPTTSSQVYSAPNTTSALTITSVGTGTITLSDTNTYNYNESGNQTTSQSVGEAHPDWICLIEGVGIKKGTTTIASIAPTVDQTYNATSTNAQSGVAVASGIADTLGTINTQLESIIAQGD